MSNITEKVKSYEDACSVLNRETTLPDFSMLPEELQKSLIAHYKLVIITEALNEGHKHDWGNGKWDKWFPWFRMNDSSAVGRFSFHGSGNRDSTSTCGSRLCFKSEKLADYAGKQFEDLYREYYVIEK